MCACTCVNVCLSVCMFTAGNHIQSGFDLGTGYYDFTIPIVEMQLAKGAVRLAGLLNKVWSSESENSPLLSME